MRSSTGRILSFLYVCRPVTLCVRSHSVRFSYISLYVRTLPSGDRAAAHYYVVRTINKEKEKRNRHHFFILAQELSYAHTNVSQNESSGPRKKWNGGSRLSASALRTNSDWTQISSCSFYYFDDASSLRVCPDSSGHHFYLLFMVRPQYVGPKDWPMVTSPIIIN